MEPEEQYTGPQTENNEPGSFRLILTLAVAGLFSGLLLVGVYLWARPLIAEHRAEALREAIYEVLPGAVSHEVLEWRDGSLEVVEEEESGGKEEEKEGETERIFAGYDENGRLVGFAVEVAEPGYQDLIEGIFGYDAVKEQIIGYRVLESKETPGLGDKIIKDENFKSNFKSLDTRGGIEFVKQGEKTEPNEVEGITGATISSRTVFRMLEEGLEKWKERLEEYIKRENIPES